MTHPEKEPAGLSTRIERIDTLERWLVRKAAPLIQADSTLTHADFFVFGAFRRTLAQAMGFRMLVEQRNFPCAAAILRVQIDTAMRLNALLLVDDYIETCRQVLDGARFNRLSDAAGKRMTDGYLRGKLAQDHPWVNRVYERTSDFVHLSGQHFYTSIDRSDNATRTVNFSISGTDPERPEETYFEVVDTFLEATKLVGLLTLGYLNARHQATQSLA
jgi:hypothetical protein